MRGGIDELLSREWLITNRAGGYASSSVIGCPTRRYHGLLIAPRRAPLERFVTVSQTLDQVTVDGNRREFSAFEFADGLHAEGLGYLMDFQYNVQQPAPWVKFIYRCDDFAVSKRVSMLASQQAVRIQYEVEAPGASEVVIEVAPMICLRDFHSLRRKEEADVWDKEFDDSGLFLSDRFARRVNVAMTYARREGAAEWSFVRDENWWYDFKYRADVERGFVGGEDLYCPGRFVGHGTDSFSGELVVAAHSVDGKHAFKQCQNIGIEAPAGVPSSQTKLRPPAQLELAADQFVVGRESVGARLSSTVIAGYHWFGDWGRDTFVSLPGLLLVPQRYDDAREVLETFARVQHNGLIPNHLSDYGGQCVYNSVDASLWYVNAANAYLNATDDDGFFKETLVPVFEEMFKAFETGTDFDIRADADGFLCCGNPSTQLTWMDAKCGDEVFTPRHGRPVEVNALWYNALSVFARRLQVVSTPLADRATEMKLSVRDKFESLYWNEGAQCLYDVVRDDEKDGSIRPNQIIAVSLMHTCLSPEKQGQVLDAVTEHLLTPYGLRSLAPSDPCYCGCCAGGVRDRDRAYHQGTVWAWLIGPYVEAYLRVHHFSKQVKVHCQKLLEVFDAHLGEAGLGTVSEIFDGDPPHAPRGCIAQAWSVAEIIRAYKLVEGD